MSRRASIRASDDDRENVAERLRQAAGEGRLLAHELEERLGRALRARTYGELDEVVWDLPGTRVGVTERRARRGVVVLRNQPAVVVAIVIAVAVVTVLVALALFLAFWAGWLVIVAFVTLLHRRGRYGGTRYGGSRYGDRSRV
jgi:hypothetical protein